jgi:hypothetical protein
MAEQEQNDAAKRDRSPAFPYIGLGKALQRIEVLFGKVRRHEARVADIATDWKLSPKSSSTDRTVAALEAFGLIETSGAGDSKKVKISDAGVRILDDGRPGVKEKLLAEVALRPRVIAEYAEHWKDGRPDDTHSLSQLKFEGGFTDEGAKMFLRVFDETIRFTQGVPSDKIPETEAEAGRQKEGESADSVDKNPPPPARKPSAKGNLMDGERELTTGMLSKGASFRLIVSGDVGVKEIDRLIAKLSLDKEILAEPDDNEDLV